MDAVTYLKAWCRLDHLTSTQFQNIMDFVEKLYPIHGIPSLEVSNDRHTIILNFRKNIESPYHIFIKYDFQTDTAEIVSYKMNISKMVNRKDIVSTFQEFNK